MKKLKFWATTLLCILCFSVGYALNVNFPRKHGITVAEANLFIFVEKVDAKYTLKSGNVITDIGENQRICTLLPKHIEKEES